MPISSRPLRPHPAAVRTLPRSFAPRKKAPPSEFDSAETLTDKAYAHLEEMIVTLQLAPGSAVSEQVLSKRLDIGRTPIREALQRLARERLVVILPRRGVIVSEINVKSQLRLLEVRRELERLLARGCARRATAEERTDFERLASEFLIAAETGDEIRFLRTDREFNAALISVARNEFAEGAMNLMNGLSRRFWYLHYERAADLPETARLHAAVATAIAAGDEQGAAHASDRLVDKIEAFTRATVSTDV